MLNIQCNIVFSNEKRNNKLNVGKGKGHVTMKKT